MSEEKKNDKKLEGTVTLLNRGLRHFEIALDASGKPIRHAPGVALVYSAEDAKRAEGYKELVDIAKMPGAVDAKKLKSENNKLSDENKRLKEQLAALMPKSVKSEEAKQVVEVK